MNLKFCKELRNIAKFITQEVIPTKYLVQEHRMLRGTPKEYVSIQLTLAPTCTKGVYRNLKKQVKKGTP